MQQKWYNTTEIQLEGSVAYFISETIEVNRLSALAFFAAGERYKGQRFFWQNRAQSVMLVGLGHAYTITNNAHEQRFDAVEQQWQQLTQYLPKQAVQPILFGGFAFDPERTSGAEWRNLPHSIFALATFQLVMKNDTSYVTIHYITQDKNVDTAFNELRKQRDELIHAAQVKEVRTYDKPQVVEVTEPGKAKYLQSIADVTARIQQQEAQKVVIARSLALTFENKPTSTQVLSHVKQQQPESYLFGFEHEDALFFGASPERLVKVENGQAYSSCVAGSIRRGATAEEDEHLGATLLADDKNRGEHHYVVEMISDIFEQTCTDVIVPSGPKLLKIRDIQHLFTPVEGQMREGATILQLVKLLHPTPALGGVPREAAMDIIRSCETMDRGLYAAPIGWLDAEGNGEFAVAIRSALLTGETAHLYAGGGIVAHSEPQSEYEETLVKFRPMLRALGGQVHE